MGNHRFRLSDMMPNVWFYKLRDMSRARSHNPSPSSSSSHSIKKNLPANSMANHSHSSHPRSYFSFNHHHHLHAANPTNSERFYTSPTNPKVSDTHFPDPPRTSSKTKARRKTVYYKPSLLHSVDSKTEPNQAHCYLDSSSDSSQETDCLEFPLSKFESDVSDRTHLPFDGLAEAAAVAASWSVSSSSCRVSSSASDIIIDMNEKSHSTGKTQKKFDKYGIISEIELPPILTKPGKQTVVVREETANLQERPSETEEVEAREEERKSCSLPRKSGSYSAGVKLRTNSPKLASKKIHAVAGRKSSGSAKVRRRRSRRSIPQSFAIVKSSFDPQKDFRDSMVEMIVENNIWESNDLEELLACYLTLNSNEYHGFIVKAFEQIWFDMPNLLRM